MKDVLPPQSPLLVFTRTQARLVSFRGPTEPRAAGCSRHLEAAGCFLVCVGQTRAVTSLGSFCFGVIAQRASGALAGSLPECRLGAHPAWGDAAEATQGFPCRGAAGRRGVGWAGGVHRVQVGVPGEGPRDKGSR